MMATTPVLHCGKIRATMTGLLWLHVSACDVGHVTVNDSWIPAGQHPNTVRGANVCYFSHERLPCATMPEGPAVAPDLVIEVRSPSAHWTGVFPRVVEYLNAGVRVVVVLDREESAAVAYRIDAPPQVFHSGDALVLADVLPGFSVPIQRLFA